MVHNARAPFYRANTDYKRIAGPDPLVSCLKGTQDKGMDRAFIIALFLSKEITRVPNRRLVHIFAIFHAKISLGTGERGQ